MMTETSVTFRDPDRNARMIEHLILILIEALANRDRAEQQVGLETAVPHLEKLRADPAAILAESEVVIPAARRGSMALLLGLIVGFAMFGLLFGIYAGLRSFLPIP